MSDLPSVGALGKQVPFNCPDCGGVLWEIAEGRFLRYRCHTGHAFTSAVLLAQRAKEYQVHIERIRAMLRSNSKAAADKEER